MTEVHWAMAVVGAGLGTYALRAAPFAWDTFRRLGRRYLRCLTYISFAVAAGIISRAIFLKQGELVYGRDVWIKVLAVATALWLFRRTRSMPAALFAAVGVAVAVKWLLAQLAGAS